MTDTTTTYEPEYGTMKQPASQGEGRFWDKVADGYAARPVPDQAIYEEKLRITREYLTPDSRVLEFGCGTGSTAIAHAPYVKHILATDVSARMIEIAEGKARDANVENVTFRQTDVLDATDSDGRVDMVMGHSILHLVHDRQAVLEHVNTLLKPGGVFVSSTPCLASWKFAWLYVVAPVARALGFFPKIAMFSDEALIRELESSGFTIERKWKPKGSPGLFLVARK